MDAIREQLARRVAELEEERDALAAHVERLEEAFDESMELHRESCAQDGEWPQDLEFAAEVWMAKDKSTTSLARLIAKMKAEALEDIASRPIWCTVYAAKASALEVAGMYRHQAEAGE